jgi:hypothetical protein
MIMAVLAATVLSVGAGPGAQAAARISHGPPRGYCKTSPKANPCVNWTHKDSTLTDNSASYYVHKGGSLSISICKSYSNTRALGVTFGPIKKFVAATFSITLVTSYSICTGASDPVKKSGWYHWHGTAKRWRSKIQTYVGCTGRGCQPLQWSYNEAQDRWHFRVVPG